MWATFPCQPPADSFCLLWGLTKPSLVSTHWGKQWSALLDAVPRLGWRPRGWCLLQPSAHGHCVATVSIPGLLSSNSRCAAVFFSWGTEGTEVTQPRSWRKDWTGCWRGSALLKEGYVNIYLSLHFPPISLILCTFPSWLCSTLFCPFEVGFICLIIDFKYVFSPFSRHVVCSLEEKLWLSVVCWASEDSVDLCLRWQKKTGKLYINVKV